MRPVSDGRASFGVLLAQFGDIAAQTRHALDTQQRQLGAILDRAAQVAATVADPEAAHPVGLGGPRARLRSHLPNRQP